MTINMQYVLDALLVVVLVGWMLYRQMTWRPVDPSRLWRGPLIFGAIGVISILSSKTITLTTLDFAVLIGEIVLSLGIGAVMGAIAHFRPMSEAAVATYRAKQAASTRSRGRSASSSVVLFESRTGWVGIVLWVLLILVRVVVDAGATQLGAHAITSTGMILLVLAANRAARVAVFSYRLNRHPATKESVRLAPRI